MALAMRRAVVKSGLRRDRARLSRLAISAQGSIPVPAKGFSTMAPEAMRPEVGTPRVIEAASPWAWKPPTVSEPWATAQVRP